MAPPGGLRGSQVVDFDSNMTCWTLRPKSGPGAASSDSDGLPPKQQGEVHGYIRHFLEPTSRAAQPAYLRGADAVYATLRADAVFAQARM